LWCISYAPSKAAIHQVTRNLTVEFSEQNIRVNAIAPGRFHTKMTEYASQNEANYQQELALMPLHGRGDENDINGVAIMLASRAGGLYHRANYFG